MIILVIFAFLAGLATIFAPCILPILPIVLSAGLSGGKQRPLGIVFGLVASFTFFTLTISFLTKSLGINANILRTIAIIVLLLFGLLLLFPNILSKFEGLISKVMPKTNNSSQRTDFVGGVVIGISLGLVWTPCVGPIVASVIALAATSSINATAVAIIIAYALGTSIPLLIVIYGGQTLIKKVRSLSKITGKLQIAFGIIMVLTALAMLFGIDQFIQNNLLSQLPSTISTGFTQQLEESDTIQNQLQILRGEQTTNPKTTSPVVASGSLSTLPIISKAPEFQGITNWLNSNPFTLNELKGKVVLIDFWTYSCINCIRTLPHVTSWYDTYKDAGLVVIGVHSPEFAFEKETTNVAKAISQFNIHYPVAQDNDFGTWLAYSNHYWPAEYLIDANGNIREFHFGEGNYDETENNIRILLKEAKLAAVLPDRIPMTTISSNHQQSPETYLGSDRRQNYQANIDATKLAVNNWTLTGTWQTSSQFIASTDNSSLSFHFIANDVYLVLNPPSSTQVGVINVLLDGKPIAASQAGADVKDNKVTINSDRLYHLVHLNNTENHTLTLEMQTDNIKAFSFTFG